MIETAFSRECSVKQGLSCQRVPTVSASTRQQSSTTRMLDDFFPPLLSCANARGNWPPTKRYRSVCYLTIYFIYLLNWLEEYFTTNIWFFFSALTLLTGWEEGHLVCKATMYVCDVGLPFFTFSFPCLKFYCWLNFAQWKPMLNIRRHFFCQNNGNHMEESWKQYYKL